MGNFSTYVCLIVRVISDDPLRFQQSGFSFRNAGSRYRLRKEAEWRIRIDSSESVSENKDSYYS
jgi:hypothetical protein